jgi:TolB-like protein
MSPTNEHIAKSLERVLESPLFKNADRQSRFLRHVVEKHLNGEDGSLREIAIGLEVYDRRETYDPKEDPIVRVEASRLRARLREYYETADADDSVRIDIPKGSYVPTFTWRGPVHKPGRGLVSEVVSEPVPASVEPPATNAKRWIIAGAVVGTILVAGSWIAMGIAKRQPPSAQPLRLDSIAVLPFSDLSEKRDLAHLTEALTEQIQDELTRNRNLRVVGSASAKQAAANSDLRVAARQVGVHALIQGSVRAEGKKVRVTVRLFDGNTGSAVWSESFEGDREKLFDMEEKISRSIADKLAVQAGSQPEGVTAPAASADPRRAQAYEYYQQARALALRESAGSLDEVFRLYQLASATDPTYAPAHAGLAGVLIETQNTLGGPDSKRKALEEARRAIALDPGLPLAYATLILYYRDAEMDWAKARAACADSMLKFPNSAQILVMCATVEGILLDRTQALQLARRTVAIDPLSPRMHGFLMFFLYQNGEFDEALKEADFAIQNGPQNAFLYRHRALILAAKEDSEGGLKVIDDAQTQFGGVPADWQPVRGYLLGQLKRRSEAEHTIREFSKQGALPLQIGLIYLGMGERAKALTFFEQSLVTEDRADLAHAIPEYYMRVLDGEPRFEALKRKLGIPAY